MLNILYTTLLPNFIMFIWNLYFSISVENIVDADKFVYERNQLIRI